MVAIKELNIGCSDFKDVIENNNYFIDKSLLIKEVIKSGKAVLLLPRPRRFGKTLNLSMLNYFFDIRQPENEKLFTGLKIWQTEDQIKEKRGKYPVIYLSFKDAKESSWKKCFELIVSEITALYEKHNYLLKSKTLTNNESKIFNSIIDRTAKETDYQGSIKKISEYLHRYHKEKVVILIDEYDTPIQSGYKKYYRNVISFMRNLMSGAFKDNSYLYKGVITGILRISRESIFSGLNNLSVHTITDYDFSDKFGFTENEVKQILSDFELSEKYELVKKWYNGYTFGETTDIYNPWSILNYVTRHREGFKTYWVNTSSDELIKERLNEQGADNTRKQLLKLVNNETIEKEIDENFVFPDMDKEKELLWTLLTFSGYLTAISKRGMNNFTLRIPNYEIKFVFVNIILKWLSVDVKVRKTLLEETTNHLINNEITEFEQGFKEIMGDTFSYFDTATSPEYVYQSYVLGLLAIIGDDYIIKSNRESGDGRYDIMLIPQDKTKYGIVIEIKQMNKIDSEKEEDRKNRINAKIIEAANQIENNKYYKELLEHKIANIIKLPIVFVGKEPHVLIKNEECEI